MVMTTSPRSVSRLSRKCGRFDFPHPSGPLRPVTGLALTFFFFAFYVRQIRLAEKIQCELSDGVLKMAQWSPSATAGTDLQISLNVRRYSLVLALKTLAPKNL
jgi:hypothetical protein